MIIVIQPAVPKYRMDFFERLHHRFGASFRVHYSPGSLGALTRPIFTEWAVMTGPIRTLPAGFQWQPSVSSLSISRSDIVVLSGNPRQLSTLILLLRARLKGARIVWWGHYWSSTSKRWRQLLRYLPLALSDAALLYTDDEVEQARSDAMFPSKRVVLAALNNGIDVKAIRPLRRPYDSTTREHAAFFIGRLTPKANLGLALEAMAQLGTRAPELHIVGDGELKLELIARAQSLSLGEKIVWHGAVTEEVEIAKVANRCKLFLYPGEVGLSLVHAMAYGLPAIVHDDRARHMPEIAAFKEQNTGVSFCHGDPAKMARVLDAALSDDARLSRWSDKCVAITAETHNTENMAARFIALAERLDEAGR